MKFVDWNTVEEKSGGNASLFDNPPAGAYIAVITSVFDNEAKEYLQVEWDFAEGNYKGNNRETYERAHFWPAKSFWSYKEKSLGFFKANKTALEKSNPGYRFNCDNVSGMIGKFIGVVLGEEEYEKKDGSIGNRLYVAQVRSIQAIKDGDFTVPKLKTIAGDRTPSDHSSMSYSDLSDIDDKLPWEM